jgi:recombinational DNA repair protein (RecF pathway)
VQLYNFAEVTLVPGREYFVLIGAVHSQKCKGANIRALAHVATLLARFLGEHDPHPELYDHIIEMLEGGEHEDLETALSIKTLAALGYIPNEPENLREAGILIDQAMRESHL